ncbi:hypothetical protein OAF27_02515, partial [Verrucomicrobiales bacterium]|nr:hypothetical protein [Verrucomicrobiales bacterium]
MSFLVAAIPVAPAAELDRRVRYILGQEAKTPTPSQRYDAVPQVGDRLSPASIQALTRLLERTPELHEMKPSLRPAFANRILNALERQENPAGPTAALKVASRWANDTDLPEVFQDYGVQHLVTSLDWSAGKPSEIVPALLAVAKQSTTEPAVTALLSLSSLAAKKPQGKKAPIVTPAQVSSIQLRARAIASDADAPPAARMSAFSVLSTQAKSADATLYILAESLAGDPTAPVSLRAAAAHCAARTTLDRPATAARFSAFA